MWLLLLLLPLLVLALLSATGAEDWTAYRDTVCGCAEGNARNWPASNPDGHGEFGAFWVAASRDDVQVCKVLCGRDPECRGFQWTATSNQIPEKNVCWFRKDAACEPSPPSVCEVRQCEPAPERDCYVKPLATRPEASSPERRNVSYDDRAIVVDGERRLLAAGSIHYARSTPEMWPGLMQVAKSGGIDVITTYVFWNLHEIGRNPSNGEILYDFKTGRLNLARFLQAAQEAGLFVFVRLGPFACAEWTYGGIPTRLRSITSNYSGTGSSAPRMTFRSWDLAWRGEMAQFVSRTMEEVRPFLAGNGGPVIVLQIENEYGNIQQYYGNDGKKYAQWAADLVKGMNTGLPIAMCQQQGVVGVIETCNGFYCDPHDPDLSYPSLFTEAWSGWFQGTDGSPGHRPASDLAYAIAKFVAEGGTMWNYYMLQGGTNFGRTAGASIATSYDYDAPISEWGFPRQPKYNLLQRLHAVLHKYEPAIVENEPLQWWSQGVHAMPGLSVHPYGGKVIFLVNSNTTMNYTYSVNCTGVLGDSGFAKDIHVPLWSVSIVDGQSCEVAFNSAVEVEVDNSASKVATSTGRVGTPSATWEYYTEATNVSWCPEERRKVVQQLPEHIGATGGPLVTDYLYASVELPTAAAVLTAMESPLVGGPLGGLHRVDGFLDGVWFEVSPGFPVKMPFTTTTKSVLTLRMSIQGLPNYLWSNSLCKKNECDGPWDSHLENFDRGLLGPIFLSETATGKVIANLTHANWTICPGLEGETVRLYSPQTSAPASIWQTGRGFLEATGTWVRLRLPLPKLACSDKTSGIALNLTGMGAGEAWVNGHSIGRYSLRKLGPQKDCTVCNRTGPYDPNGECHTRCGDYAEPLYHAPREWLTGCETETASSNKGGKGSNENLVVLWEKESGADPSAVVFCSITAHERGDGHGRIKLDDDATASRGILRPFPLAQTRLLATAGSDPSFFASAESLNTQYLKYIDTERMLIGFRQTAGLDAKGANGTATPYGGWCASDSGETCMWLGHMLSALAFGAASQHDPWLKYKGDYIVAELGKAQAAIAKNRPADSGWVATGTPEESVDLIPYGNCSSCSFYGMHKLLAGLYDQHTVAGNQQAKTIAIGIVDFLHRTMLPWVTEKGLSDTVAFMFLKPGNAGHGFDLGGIYEALFNIASLSSNPKHFELASWMYNWPFFDPLLSRQDSLNHEHANAHLPAAVGVARGWEVTGNETLKTIALNFFKVLNDSYTFPTGGTSDNEYWGNPNQLGTALVTLFNETTGAPLSSNGFHTQEMCCNYNTLKLIRHLFLWTENPAYGEAYERLLLNGAMGVQRPGKFGVYSYLTPLGNGVTRTKFDWWGWGTPDNAFWCCYGTSVETFAKLSDSIFFERASVAHSTTNSLPANPLELTVAQLSVPSVLSWKAANVTVTLDSTTSSDGTAMLAKISLTSQSHGQPAHSQRKALRVRLRVPGWAVASDSFVVPAPTAGAIEPGSWSVVDVSADSIVHVRLGMQAWLQHLNDNRTEYSGVYSIMYGPLLLAGLTTRDNTLLADPKKVTEWLQLAPPNASSGLGCADHNATYLYRPGALNKGDDVEPPSNATEAQAEAHCTNLGSKCAGFTYHGPKGSSKPALVYYKSETAGSDDPTWSTYLKPEPPPAPVGRVLRFVANGEDGKVFHLIPLQRIVDETYCTTFNISIPSRGSELS